MQYHTHHSSVLSMLRIRLLVLSVVLTLFIPACQPATTMEIAIPTKEIQEVVSLVEEHPSVIIDTDMGKDDVMVIHHMLQYSELDIQAISISGIGIHNCGDGLRNAIGLLTIHGKEDIPVACGRDQPIEGGRFFPLSHKREAENLGNLNLPDQEVDIGLDAVELLSSIIESSPQKITLLTLGPLTNIAEALQMKPDLAGNISRIFIKGGVIDDQEFAPEDELSELNIWVDPFAADLVFRSGIPITLVPLEAIHPVTDLELLMLALEKFEFTPRVSTVYDLLSNRLTAMLLEDESVASTDTKLLSVVIEGKKAGRVKITHDGSRIDVVTSIDRSGLQQLFLSTLYGEEAIATTMTLDYHHPSHDTPPEVRGTLSDRAGSPIADIPIQYELSNIDGVGLFSEHSISGKVPDWAAFGLVGYRVWFGARKLGSIVLLLDEVSYNEGEGTNIILNSDFSKGLDSWNVFGSALVRAYPGEHHIALIATDLAEQNGFLNSDEFAVTPGQRYTATFNASATPSISKEGGAFVIVFWDYTGTRTNEVLFADFEPVYSMLGETTSDVSGSFHLDLPENLAGEYNLKVFFPGSVSYFPAVGEMLIQEEPLDKIYDGPEHRIGVRTVDGVGEFFDKETGLRFTPRGVNYVWFPSPSGLTTLDWFRDDIFDRERIRNDFAALRERGYNTVRLFIDLCSDPERDPRGCMGDPDGGLNEETLDKVADIFRIAKEESIYLIPTSNDMPDNGGYWTISDRGVSEYFDVYRSHHYLTEEGVLAARIYWRDLLQGLIEREVPFDHVLGWALLNEQWIDKYNPPLSLRTGKVRTANGKSYDLSDPEQKRNMVADGVNHYITQLRDVVLSYDPTALITMGFFAPQFPNPTSIGSEWYVDTEPLLRAAPLDFFDFHAYLGEDIPFSKIAENFGMLGYSEKLIILGEFGAFHSTYPSSITAARDLERMIDESCEYGFDGWLYWEYYGAPLSWGDSTWSFVANENYIMDALSPIDSPEYCGE